jgi:hypothetical protein
LEYFGEDVLAFFGVLCEVFLIFHDEDHIETGEKGDGEACIGL